VCSLRYQSAQRSQVSGYSQVHVSRMDGPEFFLKAIMP